MENAKLVVNVKKYVTDVLLLDQCVFNTEPFNHVKCFSVHGSI